MVGKKNIKDKAKGPYHGKRSRNPPLIRKGARGLRRGVRFMIFTRTEIEALRLCAWCKDLPTGSAEILPENTIRLLLILGLIRKEQMRSKLQNNFQRKRGFASRRIFSMSRISSIWEKARH